MDAKDRQIIRALQKDGRMTNQDLAEAVNLSPSPCLRRVRNLEARGIIKGYTADVDTRAYGMSITAFVRIRLERHNEAGVQAFEKKVRMIDEVQECHMMTGTMDYLLKVLVPDLDAYEAFVRKRLHLIGSIASIDTSFVYGTVKKTAIFPLTP